MNADFNIFAQIALIMVATAFGGISACGLWVILFQSPLFRHFMHFITDRKSPVWTSADFQQRLLMAASTGAVLYVFVYRLWSCPVCQSVWVGAITTVYMAFALPLPAWGLPIAGLGSIAITRIYNYHVR